MSVFPQGYRAAGLLLHVTSLPSRFGIGDLGPAALAWVDRLGDAGQSWWQALPLGPTGMAIRRISRCLHSPATFPRQSGAPNSGRPAMTMVRGPWSLTSAKKESLVMALPPVPPRPSRPWQDSQ